MADDTELHQHLDSALQALPAGIQPDQVVIVGALASWTHATGYVTVVNPFLGKRCNTHFVLEVDGSGVTGGEGTVQFTLNNFHCLNRRPVGPSDPTFSYDRPVNVIATARGEEPAYLTVTTKLTQDTHTPSLEDVEIAVFSWAPDGTRRPRVPFSWHCSVPTSQQLG